MAALAALLDGQGKFAEAEQLYRRALAIFKRTYGSEHYELAVNFNNLAAIQHKKGHAVEAERLYQRALRIKEKLLGRNYPDVAMTVSILAMCCQAQGKIGRAKPLFQRALWIFEKALGPKHQKSAACPRVGFAALRSQAGRTPPCVSGWVFSSERRSADTGRASRSRPHWQARSLPPPKDSLKRRPPPDVCLWQPT